MEDHGKQGLDNCAFIGPLPSQLSGPPQSAPAAFPPHNNFHLPPPSPQHVVPIQRQPASSHRPLVPRASMPPLPLVANQQLSQQQQPPPPLVRHSTYTASSDTFTDHTVAVGSLVAGGQHHQHTELQRAAMTPPHQQVAGHFYGPGSQTLQNRNSNQSGQQAGRFRRAATTRESSSKWRPASGSGGNQVIYSQQQQYQWPTQQSADEGSSDPKQRAHHRSDSGGKQRHEREIPASVVVNSINQASDKQTRQPSSTNKSNNPSQRHGASSTRPMDALITHHTDDTNVGPMVGTGALGTQNVAGLPPAATAAFFPHSPMPPMSMSYRALSALSGSGGGSHQLFANASPFEAVAFCPPVPIITSHRTNSPWMRLSSIILTPIGLVIILFIVVSPLLHYLM